MKQNSTFLDGRVEPNMTTPRVLFMRHNPPAIIPYVVGNLSEMMAPFSPNANARYHPLLRFLLHVKSDLVRRIPMDLTPSYTHYWKVIPSRASVIQQGYQGVRRDSYKGAERKHRDDKRQIRFDGIPEFAQLDFPLLHYPGAAA